MATFLSCGQVNNNKSISVVTTDTLQTNIEKKVENKRKMQVQDHTDSIIPSLDKVLYDALKIANQNIKKNRFIKKYQVSSIPVTINLDYHFTNSNPHLIIRRNYESVIYIDIYSKENNKFDKVISYEQYAIKYTNDTIRDINGDSINDFVVNWYGSSGCCLKAFSDVYLLRPDKKNFSKNFEFINPTFSPKEKLVRGVCYGYAGDTEMYKSKWNGEKVDILEYVSYQKNNKGVKTGKIVISHGKKFKTLKVLNSVPTEYRKIEGYDWFTGKGYN